MKKNSKDLALFLYYVDDYGFYRRFNRRLYMDFKN